MTIEKIKSELLSVLNRYPIKHAAIFGSYSRNEQSAESDVDLLIEPSGSFTMFQLLRLEIELSDRISRKVDVVEYGALKSSMRNRVLSEAISIL